MEDLENQLVESRLRTETVTIVLKGFGIAFVIAVMLWVIIKSFG